MADINKVNFDYIKRWEGGLSKHPKDPAAKYPVPDGSGYHTNIGVTWQTWNGVYRGDVAGFYEMPKDKWVKIYKLYWDMVGGSRLDSQIIAEFLADWAWASGSNSPRQMQYYLHGIGLYTSTLDGRCGNKTISAMNKAIQLRGESAVYADLYHRRIEWLKRLPGFVTFGKGWVNRLEDFDRYALQSLSQSGQ